MTKKALFAFPLLFQIIVRIITCSFYPIKLSNLHTTYHQKNLWLYVNEYK